MAHPGRKDARLLAAAAAAFVACLANDAWALALGDAQVRSSLGDSLDLRIPVTLASGESIEPGCFSLVREPAGEIPRVSGARISVERSAAGTQLRVQSRGAMDEPAVAIGIIANCPGLSGEVRRDYALLLDPPAAGRAAPSQGEGVVARAPPDATSLRSIAATLMARIGDTLDSIANAIFPRNRAVKKSYIEALRDTNPALATLGDNDAIPVDTPIALPDLRTFARSRPPRATQLAREETPKATRAPRAPAPRQPRREPAKPARAPATPAPALALTAPPAPSPAPTSRRSRSADGFVLRLSSPEVDLTRSRAIDDRMRAQLRERQMILDADDQVSAVLALRHSVKQLESRVAELQLKLAGMPTTFPPPRPLPEKAAAPEKAPAPPVIAAAPEKAPPPPVIAAAPEKAPPPPVAAPAPVVEPPPAVTAPPVVVAPPPEIKATTPEPAPKSEPPAAKPQDRPIVRRAVSDSEWLNYGLWVLAVLLLFAAAYLAWRLWQRRRANEEYAQGEVEDEDEAIPEVPEAPLGPADDSIVVADEVRIAEPEIVPPAPAEFSTDGRRIIDADELSTRIGNDSDDLRRRYIEERFPEIMKGAINLDDPDSIVKGARLFYEDGAVARAVELLQLAIERRPADIKCWLALFEIFRLEHLTGEFAALAHRFREQHGMGPYWPKVQYFGREIDPGNALYQPPPIDKFQTIGPRQARQLAADASFDPVAENWLGAPMDFENEVLANDLRKAVMAEAGIMEGDLLANPMPALRNVEMFTVA